MNYEQKYNEALERAKEFYNDKDNIRYANAEGMLEDIFPELKESEDEKVRKVLIDLVKCNERCGYFMINNITTSAMLAWLEKQGKSSDQIHYWTEEEIEPIISDYLRGAEHYGGMIGRLRCLKPKPLEKQRTSYTKSDVDDAYLKGITDAKNELEKQGEKNPAWSEETDDDAWMNDIISKVENNLQLNKAEVDWLKSIRPQPKQEWSKWDESYLSTTIAYLKDAKDFKKTAENCINWLKSLKQRIKKEAV